MYQLLVHIYKYKYICIKQFVIVHKIENEFTLRKEGRTKPTEHSMTTATPNWKWLKRNSMKESATKCYANIFRVHIKFKYLPCLYNWKINLIFLILTPVWLVLCVILNLGVIGKWKLSFNANVEQFSCRYSRKSQLCTIILTNRLVRTQSNALVLFVAARMPCIQF